MFINVFYEKMNPYWGSWIGWADKISICSSIRLKSVLMRRILCIFFWNRIFNVSNSAQFFPFRRLIFFKRWSLSFSVFCRTLFFSSLFLPSVWILVFFIYLLFTIFAFLIVDFYMIMSSYIFEKMWNFCKIKKWNYNRYCVIFYFLILYFEIRIIW